MIMPAPSPDPRLALQRYLTALLAADWEDPNGPLLLNGNLTPPELANAPFFFNARCLLQVLDAVRGTPATAAGNLNRPFVHRIADLLVPRAVPPRAPPLLLQGTQRTGITYAPHCARRLRMWPAGRPA
ncbi:MAG TPA: hypothetical protein VL486_06760 [Verrucomicrobiae bacterium]|nr:hypothetical protein [Verrucomicrobiae bacterium]